MAESGEVRAKKLLDLVHKSPKTEKTRKAIFKEAQFVRGMLADMLLEENPDKYIELIFEIFVSNKDFKSLAQIMDLSKEIFEKLKRIFKKHYRIEFVDVFLDKSYNDEYGGIEVSYLTPLLKNRFIDYVKFASQLDKFYNRYKKEQNGNIENSLYLNNRVDYNLSTLCVLFGCKDALEDIRKQINLFFKNKNYKENLHLFVEYLRYLNFGQIKSFNTRASKIAYGLITHPHCNEREFGLNILIAINDKNRNRALKDLLDDRSKYVRELASDELQRLKEKDYNHREYLGLYLWESLTYEYDFENELDIFYEFPKRLWVYISGKSLDTKSPERVIVAGEVDLEKEEQSSHSKSSATDKKQSKIKKPKSTQMSTLYGNEHTEIQGMLAKIGAIQGFDIHIAANDRSKEWQGGVLGKFSIDNLPYLVLPQKDMQQIGLIDILWLNDGNYIDRGIEIEYSTSIYSGLLRLQDLALSIPNLRIETSLAIPKKRLSKLKAELSRTSFERLKELGVSYCTFEDIENAYNKYQDTPKGTVVKNILPWKRL